MESPIIEDRFYKENDKDMELDDWSPPAADLTQKMVTQIEHYLSDENLAKDAFLLKHVKKNKMGYVNIKLLTSFKKMKPLTKDWRVTAYALNYSSKLEVNKEGNKVRRKDPIPESLLVQVPSRLLFMWNISAELTSSGNGGDEDVPAPQRSTMEMAITLLEPFGSICTVRVFRPGKELPQEVQRFANRYPELCSQESVLVEYEDLEGAGRAYHQLSQSEDFVRVVLIGMTSKKKAGHKLGGCVENRGAGKGVSITNRCLEQLQFQGEDSSAWSSSSESEMASPMHMPRFSSGQLCRSPWDSPRSSPYHSPRVLRAPLPTLPRVSPLLASEMWRSPDTSPDLSRRNYENPADSSSLWFQRRKLAAVQTSSLDDSSSSKQGRLGIKRVLMGDSLPPGVIRFPYGPDGTRGFPSSFVGRTLQYTLKT